MANGLYGEPMAYPGTEKYAIPRALLRGLRMGLEEYRKTRKRKKAELIARMVLDPTFEPSDKQKKLVGPDIVEIYKRKHEEEATEKARKRAWEEEERAAKREEWARKTKPPEPKELTPYQLIGQEEQLAKSVGAILGGRFYLPGQLGAWAPKDIKTYEEAISFLLAPPTGYEAFPNYKQIPEIMDALKEKFPKKFKAIGQIREKPGSLPTQTIIPPAISPTVQTIFGPMPRKNVQALINRAKGGDRRAYETLKKLGLPGLD